MKTFRLFALITLLAGSLALPMHAAEAGSKSVLHVQVDTPFVFDRMRADDIQDALFLRVRDALEARQKNLEVRQLDSGDRAEAGAPMLMLSLINWRVTPIGDIECRFSADYVSAVGRRSLGVFDGTTSALLRSRAFIGSDFERAATEAGRRLGDALKKQGLI